MDDKQLLWNRYNLHIELYIKYMDMLLKLGLFYYGITGALLSFYFKNGGNGTMLEYSLLLPILFGLGFVSLFIFADRALNISQKDILELVRDMEFKYYVNTKALIYSIRISAVVMIITVLGITVVFFCKGV